MLGKNLIQAAAGSAGGEAIDRNFANTVLLLHGDGNQGATNFSNAGDPTYLAFKDNSSNNCPITVNGDAYGDNYSPFDLPEKYWSVDFGNGAESAVMGAINPGTVPLTLEFWLKFDGVVNYGGGTTAYLWTVGSKNPYGSIMQVTVDAASQNITFKWGYEVWGGGGPYIQKTTSCPIGEWHHYLWTRSGSSAKLYVDGVFVGSGTGYNGWSSSTAAMDGTLFFNEPATNFYFPGGFNGQMSNFRLTTNQVLVTGDFTPSTTGLTTTEVGHTGNVAASITGTVECVLFNSNNFYDTHTSRTLAPRYNPGTQNKSSILTPFDYDVDETSGSGYFDGTGDNIVAINVPTDFGTSNDFTLDLWIHPTALGGVLRAITDPRSSDTSVHPLIWINTSNRLYYYAGGAERITSSTTLYPNTWYHVAVVRSSNTTTMYLNGVSQGSFSDSLNYISSSAFYVAQRYASTPYNFLGYISNIRVLNGTAIDFSSTGVPTEPPTSNANTSLLTCQYAGTVRNVGFIDSGPYDFPITRVGNTTQGTYSPFSKPDGAWGNYFNGSTDLLTTPTGQTNLTLGTSDFTIEGFFYPTAQVQSNPSLFASSSDINLANTILVQFNSSTNEIVLFVNNVNLTASSTNNDIVLNTWNHIAVCRTGGDTYTFYINGTLVDNVATNSTSLTTNAWRIGYWTVSGNQYTGYINSFRIIKGTALYTGGSLTVPTSSLTAVANTQLLTCQSNRFVDNSTNNYAITLSGTPKVTPFSPFPITTEYSPAVNGGSGYFDGSGDYLDPPSHAALGMGTGDFTIHFWVYLNSGIPLLIDFRPPSKQGFYPTIYCSSSNGLRFYTNSADRITSTVPLIGRWTHIALVRSSGSTKLYANGSQVGSTYADSNNYVAARPRIGASGYDGSASVSGYMSSVAIVKGTAVWTTDFTPPTAPPTATPNTSLLCNFTDAGIYDNTGFNNLETVGNAQIDTTTKKFGTGAMKFDGSGDWLLISSSENNAVGSGPFTIEFWIYPTANFGAGGTGLVSSSYTTNFHVFGVASGGNNLVGVYVAGSSITSSVGISLNTWTHIACVRSSGNTTKIYFDGVERASGTLSGTGVAAPLYIGTSSHLTSETLTGFIDDLRITKGVARYTSNFTVPDKSFPNIGV